MWLQRAVEHHPDLIQPPDLPPITWVSPVRSDDMAEYRDGSALKRLGLSGLRPALSTFWPRRGPQWDALGLIGERPVLVEAKAHLDEFLTTGTAAGSESLRRIQAALSDTANALGAKPAADWSTVFYQYANRLAHLHFFHSNGIAAELVFVSFVGDEQMGGPRSAEVWNAAFRVADHALGIPRSHALSAHVHHICPDVRDLD